MNPFPKGRIAQLVLVTSIVAIVAMVAVLQYRWSRKLSEATNARLRGNLHAAMLGVRQDLHRELAAVCFALPSTPGNDSQELAQEILRGVGTWKRAAAHPDLVANIFLWQDAAGKHPRILHLNPSNGQVLVDSWPFKFDPLRERLERTSNLALAVAGWKNVNKDRGATGPSKHVSDIKARFPVFGWQIDEDIPALVHPMLRRVAHDARRREVDWIIIELNRKALQTELFEELAERHFGGPDGLTYQVAVLGGDLLFSSDSGFGKGDLGNVDGMLNLFGPLRVMLPQSGSEIIRYPLSGRSAFQAETVSAPGTRSYADPIRLEVIRYSPDDRDWQLLVKHRKGSLSAVVAAQHRRDLDISFGALFLLSVSITLVVIANQRAQKFAKLQMEFVASVSHELRTPLAVISSAAENLTDGVVAGQEQLTQYGTMIKSQTQQLINMVDQILAFASTRQSRTRYELRSMQALDTINAALDNSAGLLLAGRFTVERDIPSTLPPILGDPIALTQCLHNLIANAIKYSNEHHWIRIRATHSAQDNEVQISIDDKGTGICAKDLVHIFEPFYRSPSALFAQIHGTGLGLTVAKTIAESLGGRITVTSLLKEGSSFTLHLAVARPGADNKNGLNVEEGPQLAGQQV